MEYEKQLKSIWDTGIGIDFSAPSLIIPFQQGITEMPKISYKQGVAYKPKFEQVTINTAVANTFQFWAPVWFTVNPN